MKYEKIYIRISCGDVVDKHICGLFKIGRKL